MCSINWSRYIEEVMPRVSPSAWVVFCYVLTRPQSSYRAIMEGAGLGSSHTVKRALDELTEGQHLTSWQPNEWTAPTYAPVALSATPPVAETATPVAETAVGPVAESATATPPPPVAETAAFKGISTKPTGEDDDPPVAAEKPISTRDPAIQLYREYFPYERWKKSELDQLAPLADAKDLDVLREVLTYWQAHGHHGRNITGMMSRYQREAARRRSTQTAEAAGDPVARLKAQIKRLQEAWLHESDYDMRRDLNKQLETAKRKLARTLDGGQAVAA